MSPVDPKNKPLDGSALKWRIVRAEYLHDLIVRITFAAYDEVTGKETGEEKNADVKSTPLDVNFDDLLSYTSYHRPTYKPLRNPVILRSFVLEDGTLSWRLPQRGTIRIDSDELFYAVNAII